MAKKKMGAPEKPVDMEQLAALCRLKPTQADCAAFFKVSPDTIDRRIKQATGLTFAEFRDQNLVHTRFSLIRKALKKAENGDNVMLIFCLKNLCKWSDKGEADPEDKKNDGATFTLAYPVTVVKPEV